MNRSRFRNTAAAITVCASVAAIVGIATGAAAPTKSSRPSRRSVAPPAFGIPGGPPPPAIAGSNGRNGRIVLRDNGPGPDFGGPPVHSQMVVPNKAGDGFETVTQDNGKVNSVSGSQLTITEGTEKATYKTVTLDIAADATVIRDGKKAPLGDLQSGDQVHVSQSPEGSFVFATNSQFQKKMLEQFRQHFKDLPKPPSGMPAGPPPGLPPEPMSGRGN